MNNRAATQQILDLISAAENAVQLNRSSYFVKNYERLTQNIKRVATAFSGSWKGYHATVYYENLSAPPPGDSFSVEWGLMDIHARGSRWQETDYSVISAAVLEDVDPDYENRLRHISEVAASVFEETRNGLSILLAVLTEHSTNPLLSEIQSEVRKIQNPITKREVIDRMMPRGSMVTRDVTALNQGTKVPPHVDIEARFLSLQGSFPALRSNIRLAQKLHQYMAIQNLIEVDVAIKGTKVFIGHGQSALWRALQDFIQNQLHLPWDEFNRESAAGLATTERLRAMMDDANFAFLVLTAEDEHADESLHARENVIHETGLFQGCLGFRRAIVLLEEGCSEFSNIEGLAEIRFPKGDISKTFEDVRRVLAREKVLEG